jgi:hypothetical protein
MGRNSRRLLFSFAVLAMLAPLFAEVLTPQIYILESGEVEDEDVYIAASSARIDGRIEGDLLIASGDISIGGVVTGDVFALTHGRIDVTGTVEGSVRALSRELAVPGAIGGDVAVASGTIRAPGEVGGDVLLFAGSANITGTVGRDVLGRFLEGELDGTVGGDVDISVRALRVGPDTEVGGDLLYRADRDAAISGGADVAGQFKRLPSRATFIVRVWLIGVTILSFLAFVISGMVLFLVFRSTMARATGLVRIETWRTVWVGFLAVVGLPFLSILFLFSVVGAPVGVLVMVLWLLGLVFAPVPAVAAGGDLLLRGRGGIFGAFVVGAVVWRFGIWLLPFVGVLLYTTALMAGAGGIVLASWRQRRAGAATATSLGPPGLGESGEEVPADWEPPLAPETPAAPGPNSGV